MQLIANEHVPRAGFDALTLTGLGVEWRASSSRIVLDSSQYCLHVGNNAFKSGVSGAAAVVRAHQITEVDLSFPLP